MNKNIFFGKSNKKYERKFLMEDLVKSLNCFLADLNVFYRKLQNYHWNIKGKEFFEMHIKLEQYYDEIDELAEHILMLNAQPLGTMKDYIDNTCIKEAKNEKIDTCQVINNIITDYNTLLKKANEIKEKADNIKAYGTSSLIDNYILLYMKNLWMLNQLNMK